MMQRKSRRGFTLIEVLVVVLIIGILAAIALPMYNRAVLRSRFNALMPIVKAMNDSNEAYYLEHGNYASNPQDLPVQGQSSYPTGTELELGSNMDYAYVLASNASAKNNYIMYQKHSANYPGEIHCEAITGDDLAEYICESAGGTQNLGTTLTEGYTTYVIQGTGAGFAPGVDDNNGGGAEVSCDAATAMGYTCDITTNEQGQQVKQICTTIENKNVCRTKTYNEDGSYTSVTCQANSANVCTDDWRSITYDANGNKLTQRQCNSFDSSGNCTAYRTDYTSDYTYDANGNKLTQRSCSSVDSSTGNCTAYSNSSASDYTYDANGNMLTQRSCSSVDSSTGNCTAYSSGRIDYTYDANGNLLTQRYCSSVDNSGNCTSYQSARTEYTYDANGNMLTRRNCSSVNSSTGNCTWYYASDNYDYTYDANGNKLTQRRCNSVDSSTGNCTAYDTSYNYDYTYDANGNQLTQRTCSSVDSSGNCTAYGGGYNWTYDANGNKVTQVYCTTVDSSGNCTVYDNAYYYTYDDNGKQIAQQYCYYDINESTGECTTYDATYIQHN